MPVTTITTAQRSSAKIIGVLAGPTDSGKTKSGLLLAKGLAGGDPSKIILLDTENRRGTFYADIFSPARFEIAEFPPPHSPARYVTALEECCAKGVEVIVVDSGSHEHEGTGGLEEIADNPSKRIADWRTAKREHRKFMNALLHLPAHVIVCLRAREKMDFTDPKNPVSKGILPICEKNFMFEATFSFMLANQGRTRTEWKVPGFLKPVFADGEYLSEAHGLALRNWIGGLDSLENTKNILRLAAGRGMAAFKAAFATLSKPDQKTLAVFKDTLKDLAASADKEEQARHPDDDGSPDDDAAETATPDTAQA